MKKIQSIFILTYRLLTIITGLQNLFEGNLESFTSFIRDHHKYTHLGIPSEKEDKITGRKRLRSKVEKVFKGENLTNEMKRFLSKEGHVVDGALIDEKDEIKSKYLIKTRIKSRIEGCK